MKKNWFHFIPLVLYNFLLTVPLLIYIFTEKYPFSYIRYLNENSDWASAITMLYLITYLLVSLKLFYKYSKVMQLNFSSIGNEDFKWVKKMLLGALVVSCIELTTIFYEIFVAELHGSIENITLISVIIWIGYLGYYGVNQAKILLPDFLIRETSSKNESKEGSNQNSRFSEFEINELKSNLETVLLTEKPYLDEDLTLGKLAHLIPTTDKKLSTLLNQNMKTTFYDLINKYRVEAVKEKLKSDQFKNLTLLGIAFESGFKSKTSFNRIFKRETGLSPSEYKKKH